MIRLRRTISDSREEQPPPVADMPAPTKPNEQARELPYLPPEIWTMILSQNTNLAHLWYDCRQVSTAFRACAEAAFVQFIIPQIEVGIIYESTITYYDPFNIEWVEHQFSLQFDHFDLTGPKAVAIFLEKDDIEGTNKTPTWQSYIDAEATGEISSDIMDKIGDEVACKFHGHYLQFKPVGLLS